MLSRETLEAYRKMTPSERLALTLQAMREATPWLLSGPPEVVDRRFELIRRQHDEGNQRIRERLEEVRRRHEGA